MLEITYVSLAPSGVATPLGGTVLAVTSVPTPTGSQPVAPSPSGLLVTSIRSDVWARVDMAASPAPDASPDAMIVGPGQPVEYRGRAGQRIAAILGRFPDTDDPTDIPLSSTGGLKQATDGLAVDRAVVVTVGDIAAFTSTYLAWMNSLPVASSNPDDPAPVPTGQFYKLGPGGPVVIAQ